MKQRIARERARTDAAKDQLRGRILREAVALFVAEGYAGFSMRKLARRLHYTATTLYAYYRNKDELLRAVIAEGYGRFQQYLNVPGEDPVARFAAIGKAVMDFAFQNPKLYTLMFIHRPGALYDLSPQTVQARMALLRGVAQIARQTPRLARSDEAAVLHVAELYWATIHGLVSLALTLPVFNEDWARKNLDVLVEALRPLLARAPDRNVGSAGLRPA